MAFYEAIDSPLIKNIGDNKTPNLNSAESKINEFHFNDHVEISDCVMENNSNHIMTSNDHEKYEIENTIKNNFLIKDLILLGNNNNSIQNNNLNVFSTTNDQNISKEYKERKMLMLEKLKEEYHNLVEDKKNMETKIAEFKQKEKEFEEISKKNENLNLQLDIANEKIKVIGEENKNFLERNNKITFENYELTNTNNQLKESLKYLEKERTQNKNKINSNFNKVKLYEKENNASKKKLNSLNLNLKNLTDKLEASVQEKNQLEKKMEDIKQEYENKITNLLLEQQKMIKDSFLTTLSSLEEKKIPLEFFYEEEKNSLTIMLEDIVISEFTNLRISKIDKNENIQGYKNHESNSPNKKNNKQILFESSIEHGKIPEDKNIISSPSNRSSIMNINNKNIFNHNLQVSASDHKNPKIDIENLLSLNKILSGSSKNSFNNTNTKRILLSNFSSAKKISAFYEENNNNMCSAFYNTTAPSEIMNTQFNQMQNAIKNHLNGSDIKKNNDFNNFSSLLTNNFNSNNFNSHAKGNNENLNSEAFKIDSVNFPMSSLKKFNSLNNAFIQDSDYSKIFNVTTINKNIENNTSHFENERYSAVNISAKKKSKISNIMSANKNNKNLHLNENDENFNPNLPVLLECQNSNLKKSNSKLNLNLNCSIFSNANYDQKIEINEKKGSFENNSFIPSKDNESKKINSRNNNYSLAGVKAFNNNNFERCIKNININTEQINNFNRDDIKKMINTSSSTRHRKMISLDEALNLDDFSDKENLKNINVDNDQASLNFQNFLHTEKNVSLNNLKNSMPNNEAIKKHFNFDLTHVGNLIKQGIFVEDLESNNDNIVNLSKNSENTFKNHDKFEQIKFEKDENFELIHMKIKESNELDNCNNKLKQEIKEDLQKKNSSCSPHKNNYLIDSNVNLLTITSLKKSADKMIISENQFDLLGITKSKKFTNENLTFQQNSNVVISILTAENKNQKINKLINVLKEKEQNKLIISKENFCLNNIINEKMISYPQENRFEKKSFSENNLEIVTG